MPQELKLPERPVDGFDRRGAPGDAMRVSHDQMSAGGGGGGEKGRKGSSGKKSRPKKEKKKQKRSLNAEAAAENGSTDGKGKGKRTKPPSSGRISL